MSVEANKANIRRHCDEIWHAGNLNVVDELIAPNYVFHGPENEGHGPEFFKQFVAGERAALPDIHFAIDVMVGEGDYVAVQYIMTGTFLNKMGDMEPTGKKLNSKGVVIYRFENGQQAEAWSYSNQFVTYRQLGIPFPSQ